MKKVLIANTESSITPIFRSASTHCLVKQTLLTTELASTGVGKLRHAGRLRPAKGKSAAREHVNFLNGMRPAKEKFVAREAKVYFMLSFFGSLV